MREEGRESNVISFTGTGNAFVMEEKPRRSRGGFLALMCGVLILCYLAVMHHNQQEPYSIDNPASVHYYDLWYADTGSDDEEHLLCTELAAEGACTFESDRIYRVSFKLPDILREEARQGGDWQVKVNYIASVTDTAPHIWVRVYNAETGNLYIAQSGFNLEEDVASIQPKLVLLPNGSHGLCLEEKLQEDLATMGTISFMLETSSSLLPKTAFVSGKSIYQWEVIGDKPKVVYYHRTPVIRGGSISYISYSTKATEGETGPTAVAVRRIRS